MSQSTQARTVWPTLPVADLIAAGNTPATADADLTAAVASRGIEDPLYVVTTGSGAVRVVDGLRRLSAAVAADLTDVPVTYRPVIAVSALTAHPGNVRTDLKLTRAYKASILSEGVSIPVKVTRNGDGLRVVDGHRRFAAAVAVGLTHVPYEYDEKDEAGQFLTMVTTAVHKEGITEVEEAAALFGAAELGTSVRRLAAVSGRTQKDIKTALRVGASDTARRAAKAQKPGRHTLLTMDQLATIADLEEQAPEAARRITASIAEDPTGNHNWTIQKEVSALVIRREANAHRAELEKAGAQIRNAVELSDKAVPTYSIQDAADHATACQGHVWALEDGRRRYTAYCSNPAFYGHKVTGSSDVKPTKDERRAIITGNQHWDAAEMMRRQWIADTLSPATHTKARTDEFAALTTRITLRATGILADKIQHPKVFQRIVTFLGYPEATTSVQLAERAEKAPAKRQPVIQLAIAAASYEQAVTRSVWRTDGAHERAGVRKDAARWLTWLSGLGYPLTPIEAALVAGETYNPAAAEIAASTETIEE
jgi:ParB family transcriptional regulator, chromosome partitioning protein